MLCNQLLYKKWWISPLAKDKKISKCSRLLTEGICNSLHELTWGNDFFLFFFLFANADTDILEQKPTFHYSDLDQDKDKEQLIRCIQTKKTVSIYINIHCCLKCGKLPKCWRWLDFLLFIEVLAPSVGSACPYWDGFMSFTLGHTCTDQSINNA